MKNYQLVFVLLVAGCIVPSWSGAADKVVVIPLFKNSKIVGDATPADVVGGKTFTSADGEHTGIRPPTPIGTDYVGKGVPPPDPRFQVFNYNGVEQAGYGIKDLMTGLIWMKSPGSSTSTWPDAVNSCEDLITTYPVQPNAFMSVSDWRLPTVREMSSLLDYSRGSGQVAGTNALVIPNFFTDVHNNIYWTASLIDSLCSNGQGGFYRCNIDVTVDLRYATVNHEVLDQSPPQHFSWCVRGPYGIEY